MSKKIIQPRLKFPRKHIGGSVIKKIEYAVESAAREFNCSKSFIVAVALADFFGIKIPRYDDVN